MVSWIVFIVGYTMENMCIKFNIPYSVFYVKLNTLFFIKFQIDWYSILLMKEFKRVINQFLQLKF